MSDLESVLDATRAAAAQLRACLRTYRRTYGEAARALDRARRSGTQVADASGRLHAEWEKIVSEFRRTVDRVGIADKTLGSDG